MSRSQAYIIGFFVVVAAGTAALLWPEPSPQERMAEYKFPSSKKAGMVVLGLDGLPAGLFLNLAQSGKYPNLAQGVSKGLFRRIRPEHNTSAEIWTTYFTGRPPAQHGLRGFYVVDGGQMRLHNKSDLNVPFIWERLHQKGFSVGINGFFGLYPPADRPGSFMVSLRAFNYDELVRSTFAQVTATPYSFMTQQELKLQEGLSFAVRPSQGAVTPPGLQKLLEAPCSTDDLSQWFTSTGFDLLVSALQDSYGRPAGPKSNGAPLAAGKKKSAVREMTKSLCLLIRNEQWLEHVVQAEVRPDFLATYFLGMDFVIHRTFDFAPRFHRGEAKFILTEGRQGRGLLTHEVMNYVDKWVERIVAELGEQDSLVILSDHGLHLGAVGKLKTGKLAARPELADGFMLLVGPDKARAAFGQVLNESPVAKEEYMDGADVYRFFRRYYDLKE